MSRNSIGARLAAAVITAALALGGAGPGFAAPNLDASAARAVSEPLNDLILDVEHQHPVAMFVLAKRLWDEGRRDEAVFWFYVGQLRWRAYLIQHPELAGQGGPFAETEGDRFERWMADLGPDLNGWAAGDFDGLLKMFQTVLDWDAAHPDDFTPPGPAKDQARAGLQDLAQMTKDNRAKIIAANPQRKPGAAPKAGVDRYKGSGGALFGKPAEMLAIYDPARFSGFKIGQTSKAEVVEALGAPDWWDTDRKGVSTLGYSYKTPPMFGMSQILQVSLTFDRDGRLTAINLPADE